MRKIIELIEKTLQLDDGTGLSFIVTQNPTKSQFMKMISNENADLKGLVTDKDFFIWPAWHSHHHEIGNRLGLYDKEDDTCARVFVQHDGMLAYPPQYDFIRSNPQIKYLYGEKGPRLESES